MPQKPKAPSRTHVLRKPRLPPAANRSPRTVEQLAGDQGVQPVADPQTLRGNFWSDDDRGDEFLLWLRAIRWEPRKDA